MKQPRRLSPRVPYDEPVCLTRADGRGRLFGRSVNLAASGIYIRCAEPCEIGTELICSVLLPGGARKLRGRVRRIIAAAPGVGMAIAFEALRPGDRAAIDELIAAHQREVRQAQLRLDGIAQPVRCEAVLDARTVHLSATLPFLRLDAGVGVVLGDQSELTAQGVISKIALDPACGDGLPRLALDVVLGGESSSPAGDSQGDEAAPPPPSALPEPYGRRVPSVVLSPGLEDDLLAQKKRPALVLKRRHVRGTALLPRRRFNTWTTPPPFVTAVPAAAPLHTTEKVQHLSAAASAAARRRWLRVLVFVPVAAAVAALLVAAAI
jgi:hypothetical protein